MRKYHYLIICMSWLSGRKNVGWQGVVKKYKEKFFHPGNRLIKLAGMRRLTIGTLYCYTSIVCNSAVSLQYKQFIIIALARLY